MATNFKCFADPQGFEQIKPINVIIGRNNSGKSSLLDLINVTFGPAIQAGMGHRGQEPLIYVEWTPTDADIGALSTHSKNMTVSQRETIQFSPQSWARHHTTHPRPRLAVHNAKPEATPMERWSDNSHDRLMRDDVVMSWVRPVFELLDGYEVRRLAADRDVKPEGRVGDAVNSIHDDGSHATMMVHDLISFSDRRPELIETELLNALNEIFWPDSQFDRILVQSHRPSKLNEIYVVEESKGRIPLSRMGSGFKTVLLVRLHLIRT